MTKTLSHDQQIAQQFTLRPLQDIANKAGIPQEYFIPYGRYAAKIDRAYLETHQKKAKLVLVSAISPTPAGEGKTTTSIGLADALNDLGHRTHLALREPSMGPVFGRKGGATGGGHAQVAPMETINLHFTGDFHAIGAANNLLAALIDHHLHQGNALDIDPATISWSRCVDMNDRALRHTIIGLDRLNGPVREDHYEITVASEIMAIFCLSRDLEDLKSRLGSIVIGKNRKGENVTAHDLKAEGAMCALLVDALDPNLVQTLYGTPAFIHGGPFANIAHGCNSILATQMAMHGAEYAITEAGFGADLGAEKFLDIHCPTANLRPDAVVLVATLRALKYHGGVDKKNLEEENVDAIERGFPHLLRHAENLMHRFGLPAVIALNQFTADTPAEMERFFALCTEHHFEAVCCSSWAEGPKGAHALANAVMETCKKPNQYRTLYHTNETLKEKIDALAAYYGAAHVEYAPLAEKKLRTLQETHGQYPICVVKTPYSFADDEKLIGAPTDFTLHIRDVALRQGAQFIVIYTGSVLTMPGLPKIPAAERIDVIDGAIHGLF